MRTFPRQTIEHARARFHYGPALCTAVLTVLLVLPSDAKIKHKAAPPVNSDIEVTATLADAVQAVEEVASDPVLYGTYVYERDKTLKGARATDASSAFRNGTPNGKVFYKVVDDVIAPRYFKDSEDSGTVTVRYVVRSVNPATVSIRVDAVFVESAHRAIHASEGAVESAEFGQIQQHLNRIQVREKEAQEEARIEASEASGAGVKPKPEAAATVPEPALSSAGPESARPAPIATALEPAARALGEAASAPANSAAELEQRVNRLRHQVEARIKPPGAPLKSAPFHTATTIQTVPADSEVAIVILTSYWYGVQTTDGHTGWIQRSQLEPLP